MPQTNFDATADFAQTLADPTRWVIKRGVPIFKPHQRTDPNTQKLIRVDLPKLYRIAENLQRLERQGGVPIRMTLGHTEPGKAETEQPPVAGYYRNARVQRFGPKGEPAIVVDEWLDPQYTPHRKNYPYRSAEYYDDAEQITGVALLTRDPYLDLGVVAYDRGESLVAYTRDSATPAPLMYERGVARHPVMYQLVIGEVPMPAPQQPVNPPAAAGVPQIAPVYAGQASPTPYAGPWPGPAHRRANIGHRHQSGGAIYATEGPPPDMGGGPPGMPGGGGGGNPMEQLRDCLMQAVQIASELAGGGGGGPPMGPGGPPPGGGGSAPETPFPDDEEPTMSSRYGQGGGRPRAQAPRYPHRGSYTPRQAYQRQPAPQAQEPQPQAPARTISGLPVGYQMKLDQLQYQNNEQAKAIQLLLYERDQADTEACAAEISRLAASGYQVGEYEFQELKAKPRAERAAYIQHITTKYQRIGTDTLPPLLGDPTPGDAPNPNRPLTRDEMDKAIRLSESQNIPYDQAIHYIRGGGPAPTMYGAFPGGPAPGDPRAFAWGAGQAAPGEFPASFVNPYEPSENGAGY